MNYMVTWINVASEIIGTAKYVHREGAIAYAERLRKSPETYRDVMVLVRGQNGYFQPTSH